MTGDKDIELALHYAPLSDTYIRHIDENGKPKANKVIATANNNVVLTEYFLLNYIDHTILTVNSPGPIAYQFMLQ